MAIAGASRRCRSRGSPGSAKASSPSSWRPFASCGPESLGVVPGSVCRGGRGRGRAESCPETCPELRNSVATSRELRRAQMPEVFAKALEMTVSQAEGRGFETRRPLRRKGLHQQRFRGAGTVYGLGALSQVCPGDRIPQSGVSRHQPGGRVAARDRAEHQRQASAPPGPGRATRCSSASKAGHQTSTNNGQPRQHTPNCSTRSAGAAHRPPSAAAERLDPWLNRPR